MEIIREYVISVCASAMLCSVILLLINDGPTQNVIKTLCGLYIIIAMIKPILSYEILEFDHWNMPETQVNPAIEQGKEYGKEAVLQIIKYKTEEYILDKAHGLNAELRVEVQLNENSIPAPKTILLFGDVSFESKQQLQKIIENDLGIPKEEQIWIGQN